MFSRVTTSPLSRSVGALNSSVFLARSINRTSARWISSVHSQRFTEEWGDPGKQKTAKDLTLETIVPTVHFSRKSPDLQPPLPPGKEVHASVKFAHGSTYGQTCAVDKVHAVCAEHLLLMRSAIYIARHPNPDVLAASRIIATELGNQLAHLNPKAVGALFQIGSSVPESRSRDVLENPQNLIRMLQNPDKLPPQQLLRVLEVALSPLGMIANSYGGAFCKVAKAKASGTDVGDFERFMEKEMMPSLSKFYIPYIKAQGSPFAHLQMQQYAHGAKVSAEELVTINHYLESCGHKHGEIPEIPRLRSVVVTDPTGRTLQLHDHMNLPHFFDVSGTTGAVMQASLGLLHKAGRSDLASDPEATTRLGMVLAGCNFYKQGYHNYYEVLPALQWVNHHVWNKEFVHMTPMELLHAVPTSLKGCVDSSTKTAPTVFNALDLVTDHFELHYQLHKEHIQEMGKQMVKDQTQTSVPTLGGSGDQL